MRKQLQSQNLFKIPVPVRSFFVKNENYSVCPRLRLAAIFVQPTTRYSLGARLNFTRSETSPSLLPSKHLARDQDQIAYLQRSFNVVVTSFTMCSISCCANAGRREQSPKRCEILSSQPCSKTRVTAVTATIIGASLSFALLASSWHAWHFIAFSSLHKECTLSLSVVFDPNAQRLI